MVAPLRLRVTLIRTTLIVAAVRQHENANLPAIRGHHVPSAALPLDVDKKYVQQVVAPIVGNRAKTADAFVCRIARAGRAGTRVAAASAGSAPRGRLVT